MKQISFIDNDGSVPNRYRSVNVPDDEYGKLLARSKSGQNEMAAINVGDGEAIIMFNTNDITETPYGITIIIDQVILEK